jgi:hypothetical protein
MKILSKLTYSLLPEAEQNILSLLFSPDVELAKILFASQILGIDVKEKSYYESPSFKLAQIDFLKKVGLYTIIDGCCNFLDYKSTKLAIKNVSDDMFLFRNFDDFNNFNNNNFKILIKDLSVNKTGKVLDMRERQIKSLNRLLNFPFPIFAGSIINLQSYHEVKDEEILLLFAKIYNLSREQRADWHAFAKISQENLIKIINLSKQIK